MLNQVKSKQRISNYGEVYTADREVQSMLDLLPQSTFDLKTTFLEPACGNGNFLEAILKRKLESFIKNKQLIINQDDVERNILLAITSIYGVDIQKDNVLESRKRLENCIDSWYFQNYSKKISSSCLKGIKFILEKNIICGNTLTKLNEKNKPLRFSEWNITKNGNFFRKEYKFEDVLNDANNTNANTYRYYWLKENEVAYS